MKFVDAVQLIPTDLCSYSVAFGVEKSSDLHKFTVSLDVVINHRRLHKEGVVTFQNFINALLSRLHEDTWFSSAHALFLSYFHEVPHRLVRWNRRLLRVQFITH